MNQPAGRRRRVREHQHRLDVGAPTRRATNLGLAALIVLAVISGAASFAVGTDTGRFVVVFHGVFGLGVIALSPWKALIARRGLSRNRPGRWTSLSLTLLAVITVVSGIVLTFGLFDRLGPLTMMQTHVGAGVATTALTALHFAKRPVRPRRADLSRRAALRATGTLGAASLIYAGSEGLLALAGLPGSDRRFTGSHEIAQGPPPQTQWLNDRVPDIDRSTHVVATPIGTLSIDDIDRIGDEVTATLDCTGGWHATRSWQGARLDRFLDGVAGQSLVVRSSTGYWRRFPIDQADRLWLATRLEDRSIPAGNGAPVRLVAPDRRGFWWVKWVVRVDVDDLPAWWQPPLPLA